MLKWGLRLGLGTILLVAVAIFILTRPSTSHVVITNRATEAIRAGELTFGDRTYPFGAIASEQTLSVDFLHGEGSYLLSVEFESGSRLTQRLGYVTSGWELTDSVEITDSGMRITAEQINGLSKVIEPPTK